MKQRNFLSILSLVCTLLLACTKQTDIPAPDPLPGNLPFLRFSIAGMGDNPPSPQSLRAVVSISNQQGQPVFTDKVFTLSYIAGALATDTMVLAQGNYSLTKFLLVDGANAVRFATPMEGSVKAYLVQEALPMAFTRETGKSALETVMVTAVNPMDTPGQFGYPAGTFNNPGSNDENGLATIFVKPAFGIGELVYDSMPATLAIKSWDAQENMTYTTQLLAPGANRLMLPRNKERFQFTMSRFGIDARLDLAKNEVENGKVYTIGGNAIAQKLKEEENYRLVNNEWVPESRTLFSYDATGNLLRADHYQNQHSPNGWARTRYTFVYQNNRLTTINTTNQHDEPIGYTRLTYNAEGQIAAMEEKKHDSITIATYTYLPQQNEVSIRYQYSYHHYTAVATKTFSNGLLTKDVYSTSHGDLRTGLYGYDGGINPYAHIGWPNVELSHLSKSNINEQTNSYQNSQPAQQVYSFAYRYNAQAYPVEVVRQYRSPLTQQHLYTLKTVYKY